MSTKIRILKGREITTGGKTIIPIPSRTEATTMSITKKGMYTFTAIMKAVFNSESK
jgi:hypothetical protein